MNDLNSKDLLLALSAATKTYGTAALLELLSACMLLPENQKLEFRFLHLMELILQLPKQKASSNLPIDLLPILNMFDEIFAKTFYPQEIDFVYIPFLSWIDWKGFTYRMFSGTLAEPEIYFADQFAKGASLDQLLSDKFSFSFSDLADFILPRTHSYIEEAELYREESRDSALSSTTMQAIAPPNSYSALWKKYFTIPKCSLTAVQLELLSRIARRPGQFKPNLQRLFRSECDLMRYPVVNYGETFQILCPQLLIPALLYSVSNELAKNHKLTSSLIKHLRNRVLRCLQVKFCTEPASILRSVVFNNQPLADFAVLFDHKILLFSATGNDLKRLQKASNQHTLASENLLTSDHRILTSETGVIQIAPGPVEILNFFIVDSYSEMELLIPEDDLPKDQIAETLPVKALEYVLSETTDALHFIKFFRMRNRAHNNSTSVLETGRPILDSFAIFKLNRWLKPLAVNQPKLLMVDNHSFGEYHFNKLVAYRQKNTIHELDGSPRRFRRHYPGCLQLNSRGQLVAVIHSKLVQFVIRGQWPSTEEGFRAWHVSVDTLCYYFGTRSAEWDALWKSKAPRITTVEITVSFDHDSQTPTNLTAQINEEHLQLDLKIYSSILPFFSSGNNEGERLVLRTVLMAMGLVDNKEFEVILPASNKRRMQLTAWRPPHSSWTDAVKPIPIYQCDEELTITTEWNVLRKNGKTPGIYKEKVEIYSIFGEALQALRSELLRKIGECDRDMLVTFAYTQLEAAYIQSEFRKQELAFANETAEFVDIAEEYQETARKSVDLTFAIRLVLETALQNDTIEQRPVSLEAFSELIAYANQIMWLDSFGDQLSLLERAGCELPKVELTEAATTKIHFEGHERTELAQYLFELQTSDVQKQYERSEDISNDSIRKAFLDCFDDALVDEHGFSLTDRLILDNSLLQLFDKREIPILSIGRIQLTELLVRNSSLSNQTVSAYLERLCLSKSLLIDSGSIKPSERYWRDERILNRPIICIDSKTCLFARTVCGIASQVFTERLLKAHAPSSSTEQNSKLTKAISKWSNLRGEEFKNSIVTFLKDLNWEADCEISALDGVSMPELGMGPIDIIAINRTKKRVLVLEAKRNYFSRNAKDIRNELDKYFGIGKKKGELQRFSEKIDWVMNHKDKLFIHYALSKSDEWTIEPNFITSELLFCISFRTPPCKVITDSKFRETLATI